MKDLSRDNDTGHNAEASKVKLASGRTEDSDRPAKTIFGASLASDTRASLLTNDRKRCAEDYEYNWDHVQSTTLDHSIVGDMEDMSSEDGEENLK